MRRVAPAVIAFVTVVLVAWRPARIAVQALALLPALFPGAPVDVLTPLTRAPSHEERAYLYAGGDVTADLFVPSGASSETHSALIMLLGAGDLPRSDIALHLADALARLGVVVLIPQSSGMRNERLRFDEVDAIRKSVAILGDVASVDTRRIGILGLSASGGLSLVAAGQPDLRDRLRFVNSFGSYADARTLLIDVASRSVVVDGQQHAWHPEARTLEVIDNALVDAGFTSDARAEVEAGTTRDRARDLLAAAGPDAASRLAQVSPTNYLDAIHAHVYLMHDLDDTFVPFTESRNLATQAPPGLIARYTEFSIFAHVVPDRPVPVQTFVRDVWRLFWHVHAILLELL
ncbi:MAG: hypothetical protein NVSMB2_17580 [Chloroflexota bacterium]